MKGPEDFLNIKKAIPIWKKENVRLSSLLDSGEAYKTHTSWKQWEAEQKKNNEIFQDALFEDTKEYNCKTNCRLADPLWIIKLNEELDEEIKNESIPGTEK